MQIMLMLSENWVIFPDRDLLSLVEAAKIAEECGIDAVGFGGHTLLGPRSGGEQPKFNPRDFDRPGNQDPFTPHPSATVLLSAVAAVTQRIGLVAGAILPVLRHPLEMAKELATLDLLSRGRLIIFPAVGWQEEEYQALGLDFHQRGKMLDEELAIWRLVWNTSPASYEGQFYRFDRAHLEPKPWRPNGPRLWITGSTLHPAALRRIVQFGDGYAPAFRAFSADIMAQIRTAMREAGRDPDTLEVCAPIGAVLRTPDGVADIAESLAPVRAMRDSGATMIMIKPSLFIETARDLRSFCTDLVGRMKNIG